LERKREEGGFSNLLEVYLNDLVEFIAENMLVVMGSLLVGLIGLVFMCSRPGNSSSGEAHAAQLKKEVEEEEVSSANKGEDDEEEEEDEDEDENTLSGSAKKAAEEEANDEVDAEEKKKTK
jgi:hypothetical protein